MIERAIENWLINTNERNYQMPFCQVLIHTGHKIIYVSSHGQMEQGKDIISIAPNDEIHAYQLKTGNINTTVWRQIKGEISELIELPIIHPKIDKNRSFKSILVLNGSVTDPVRIQIDNRNEDNVRKGRDYSHLEVIEKEALLQMFINAQGDFLPISLDDFGQFLSFYLADGKDTLDKESFNKFIHTAIFKDSIKSKKRIEGLIHSSIILVSYALRNYEAEKNYFALFEAWTCLGAALIRISIKYKIARRITNDALKLIEKEIVLNLELLETTLYESADLLEGDWCGDGAFMYSIRKSLVLGAIAALQLYRIENDGKPDERLLESIKKYYPYEFWGEHIFSYYFMLIKYLELIGEGCKGVKLLFNIVNEIIDCNRPRDGIGLSSSYYGPSMVLERVFELNGAKNDFTEFKGSSSVLTCILDMLARRDQREYLEKNWRELSHINIEGLDIHHYYNYFLWQVDDADNITIVQPPSQSWAELKMHAIQRDDIPPIFETHKSFMYFFLLVFPHRMDRVTGKLIDC